MNAAVFGKTAMDSLQITTHMIHYRCCHVIIMTLVLKGSSATIKSALRPPQVFFV